jgi:hypothetical protein
MLVFPVFTSVNHRRFGIKSLIEVVYLKKMPLEQFAQGAFKLEMIFTN